MFPTSIDTHLWWAGAGSKPSVSLGEGQRGPLYSLKVHPSRLGEGPEGGGYPSVAFCSTQDKDSKEPPSASLAPCPSNGRPLSSPFSSLCAESAHVARETSICMSGANTKRRRTRPPAILSAHRALRVTSAKCRGPARVTKQTPVSRTEKSGGHRTFLFRVRTGHTNRSLTGDKCGLSAKTRERRGKRSAMERSGYSR